MSDYNAEFNDDFNSADAIASAVTIAFGDSVTPRGLGELQPSDVSLSVITAASLVGVGGIASAISLTFATSSQLEGKGSLQANVTIAFGDSVTLSGIGELSITDTPLFITPSVDVMNRFLLSDDVIVKSTTPLTIIRH